MNTTTALQDPLATNLLARVGEDMSLLRQDLGRLVSHTATHTVPSGMRSLADSAKSRLMAGREYLAQHLRALGKELAQPKTAWVGGAVLMGLLAAGVYWFCKDSCAACCEDMEEQDASEE